MMTEMIVKDAKRVAKLSFENGKYVAYYNGRKLASSQSKEYVINKIKRRESSRAIELGVYDIEDEDHFIVEGSAMHNALTPEKEESVEFGINTRFEFLETLVQMIVDKRIPSLLITGEGGLGKTHTVKKVIANNGLDDVANHAVEAQELLVAIKEAEKAAKKAAKRVAGEEDDEVDDDEIMSLPNIYDRKNTGDFIFIKGYSTAKALFRILFENRDKICIFDDCDSIQKDANAVNLIKAAADSYDERWVDWHSENPFSDLPSSFRFEGQIIFISNMSYHKVDQAIRSRSMCVDLSMNTDQKIERMKTIVESSDFMDTINLIEKREALAFLEEKSHLVRDLTLRSLISVIKIRNGGADNWRQLAEYIIRTN